LAFVSDEVETIAPGFPDEEKREKDEEHYKKGT